MIDERLRHLQSWAQAQSQCALNQFEQLHEQASARRYFRAGGWIWVDALLTSAELNNFVHIAQLFKKNQIRVPEVFAMDSQQGFLWLEDLGRHTLHSVLNAKSVGRWYKEAIKTYVKIAALTEQAPSYDQAMLDNENALFSEWFLQTHLQLCLSPAEQHMLDAVFAILNENHFNQPQVCMHCDYHSLNLMALTDGEIGVLDFQDFVIGPITYDLISLLEDCYISWPQQDVLSWMTQAYSLLQQHQLVEQMSEQEFIEAAVLCGLQRHLKAIGIFSRLHHRDSKSHYLDVIPLTLNYVFNTCKQRSELAYFGRWLEQKIPPALNQLCEL